MSDEEHPATPVSTAPETTAVAPDAGKIVEAAPDEQAELSESELDKVSGGLTFYFKLVAVKT